MRSSAMVCACCGSSKHNIRGCPLPGAKRLRDLETENRTLRKAAPNPQQGRRPTKFGPNTWGKKQASKKRQAQLRYSGKKARTLRKQKDAERRQKTAPLPSNSVSELQAIKELQNLGFLQPCPKRCPACRRGAFGQPCVTSTGQAPDLHGTDMLKSGLGL